MTLRADALKTAAALSAGSHDAYLLYENRGAVSWAEGEAVVMEIGPAGPVLSVAEEHRRLSADPPPLTAVGEALAGVGGDWRAYGWATYDGHELPWRQHQSTPSAASSGLPGKCRVSEGGDAVGHGARKVCAWTGADGSAVRGQ